MAQPLQTVRAFLHTFYNKLPATKFIIVNNIMDKYDNKMRPVTFMDTERLEKLEQAIFNLEILVKELANSQSAKDPIYDLKQAAEIIGKSYPWIFQNKHLI